MLNKNLAEQLQAIYLDSFDPQTHTTTGVLSDICHYSNQKIAVAMLNENTYYSTENMQPNKAGALPASGLPAIIQTTMCHKGDVLISNIRPYFKKIIYVPEACGCSTDVLCFVPETEYLSAFLYSTLFADRFFDYMVAGAKGTKMPRGDKQQIMNYPIVKPTSDALTLFNALAIPMLEQIALIRTENFRLSTLRNTLLPKLISGEIDVSNIDL